MRPRSWTDEELREAVASSTRLIDVLRRLGLSIGGGTFDAVRNRILQLGLDCSHMERPPRSPKWDVDPSTLRTSTSGRTWDEEALREAVANSRSLRGVLVHLDLKVGGSQYLKVRAAIEELGLDTSHFTGQGWSRGLKGLQPGPRRPLESILVKDSNYMNTGALRRRLLSAGLLQPACAICGRDEWEGRPMPLQLDHINGDRRDNRLSNLRLLCPNCHALTDTWCGKNIGRYEE